MNYTLHQLEIFKKVADIQSITRAAEELYLTQPAVSIQLKKLQNQFSRPLFEVIGRQLFITDFGKEVAITIEKILKDIEDLNSKTLTFKGELAGMLKIALVSTAKYVMPFFLTDFIAENKGVTLSMDVTNKASVIESLEKNLVDFGLVSVIPDNLNIHSISLMENKLFLVGGKNYENSSKNISKKDFQNLPLVYREYGSATRAAMEAYVHSIGLSSSKRLVLRSNEAVKQALIAGLGFSIMPLIGIKNELKTGDLQIIPAKNMPIKTNWNLIWLKSKKLSTTALAYTEYLKSSKNDIMFKSFDWTEKL